VSTFFQMVLTQAFSLKNQCLSDINVHDKSYGKDTENSSKLGKERNCINGFA